MLQKLILKAIGDLTGNKIADKITSADKSKEDDKMKKVIYIPPEKVFTKICYKKWIKVYDQLEGNYNVNNEIRIKTPMLRTDVCDFSDENIVVKRDIAVTEPDDSKRHKSVSFKDDALFINCISKINGVQIDNEENLDVVMPMYNLLEYKKNYRKNKKTFVELLQR